MGNHHASRAFHKTVTPIPSEADMRHTTISGQHGTHYTELAVFWIFAGIIVVIAFRGFLTQLAVAFAIAIAISWIYSEVEHRMARNDANMAPVTHLGPALTDQRDLKKTSAHAPSRGHRAA
jgi:hypothetical protein